MALYEVTEFENDTEGIISYSLLWICLIFSGVILIHTVYNMYIKKQPLKPNKTREFYHNSIQILSVLPLAFNVLFCVVTVIIYTGALIEDGYDNFCYMIAINAPILGCARLSLYLFLVARFAGIFQGTEYDLSPRKYVILISSMFITTITVLIIYIIYRIDICQTTNDTSDIDFPLIGVATQDVVWSVATMLLFVSRLYTMSRQVKFRDQSKENENTRIMREYCRRLAILTIFTSTSTALVVTSTIFVYPAVAASLDVCINGTCMVLSFSTNTELYQSICRHVDKCCQKCLNSVDYDKGTTTSSTPDVGDGMSPKSVQVTVNKKHKQPRMERVDTNPKDYDSPSPHNEEEEGEENRDGNQTQQQQQQGEQQHRRDQSKDLSTSKDSSKEHTNTAMTDIDHYAQRRQSTPGPQDSPRISHAVSIMSSVVDSTKLNLTQSKNTKDYFFVDMHKDLNNKNHSIHSPRRHSVSESDDLLDVDLKDLTYELKLKGKRDQPVVPKINIKTMEKNPIVEDKLDIIQLKNRRNTMGDSVSQSDPDITKFGSSDAPPRLSTIEKGRDKPVIMLVLYEMKYVVATNCDIYDKNINELEKDPKYLDNIKDESLYLSFGGKSHVRELQKHFKFLLEGRKDERTIIKEQAALFMLSDEYTNDVLQKIMGKVRIGDFFSTRLGPGKYLSHVIGNDHFVKKQVDKKYLSILKILEVLNNSHQNENVLYIGHELELIEQLQRINACHTYHVKTKGMSKYDIEKIEDTYQFGQR